MLQRGIVASRGRLLLSSSSSSAAFKLTSPSSSSSLPLLRHQQRRSVGGGGGSGASSEEIIAEPVADAPGFEFNKIGLLGGGRMAEAILAGVVKEELIDPSKIVVYDVSRERLDYLKKTFGISVASSIPAVCNTDLTVICVKPQNLPGVWGTLRKNLKPQSVLLSIVAGVPIDDFVELAGVLELGWA